MINIYKGIDTQDGAGVKLTRYIGTHYIDNINPFLLLDEFKSQNINDFEAGFPWHPHRGFQTLTYIIKGSFMHEDSLGSRSVIKEGELQWMNAGSGIIHQEMPVDTNQVWGFQLWLNNPRKYKMSEPFYLNFKSKKIYEDSSISIIDLISDDMRERSFYKVVYRHILIKKDGSFDIESDKTRPSFLILSEGLLDINNNIVKPKHIVVFDEDIHLTALENSSFLYAQAPYLDEPIARRGPFVMNYENELIEAFMDYKKGFPKRTF